MSLQDNEVIAGMNNAGTPATMYVLQDIFKKLSNDDEVVAHNYVWGKLIKPRIGPHIEDFLRGVAELIETLTLRTLADGQARTQAKTKAESRPSPLKQRERKG